MVEATRKPRRIALIVPGLLVITTAAGCVADFAVNAWRASRPDLAIEILVGKLPGCLAGYEGSLDGGRDRWLVLYDPGNHAIFGY